LRLNRAACASQKKTLQHAAATDAAPSLQHPNLSARRS
jgi:hypothetical protein